jgi:hypothetical protein
VWGPPPLGLPRKPMLYDYDPFLFHSRDGWSGFNVYIPLAHRIAARQWLGYQVLRLMA